MLFFNICLSVGTEPTGGISSLHLTSHYNTIENSYSSSHSGLNLKPLDCELYAPITAAPRILLQDMQLVLFKVIRYQQKQTVYSRVRIIWTLLFRIMEKFEASCYGQIFVVNIRNSNYQKLEVIWAVQRGSH